MTLDPTNSKLQEWQDIDAQASVLMKRGMALAATPQPDSLREAIQLFDSAYELRRQLPVEDHPQLGYGLAACRLNRGETLMFLPDEDGSNVNAAILAYEEAIELLRKLPLEQDPRFPRRLAIAYQNRGLALQTQDPSKITEIAAAFTEAISLLNHHQSEQIPDRNYLLAAAYVNFANASSANTDAENASIVQHATRKALSLVAALEAEDADAAHVGLNARHTFCKSIAPNLSEATTNDEAQLEMVHQATDMVDEGLELARSWEKKGVVRFRDLAHDLFTFGARVYEKFQPQFLAEFIVENFDPERSSADYVANEQMRRAGDEVLLHAARSGRKVSLDD